MQTFLVLAKDINDFGKNIEIFTELHGMSKDQFTMMTGKNDVVGYGPGSAVYITNSASERADYKELCQLLRSLGVSPQSITTSDVIKAMHGDAARLEAELVYNCVWDAVESGIRPNTIVVQSIKEYNKDSNSIDVKVGLVSIDVGDVKDSIVEGVGIIH